MLPNVEHQIEYYNERWKDAEYAGRLKLRRTVAILNAVESTGFSKPRICDLGCGTGWFTSILGMFGPTTGVDFSDVAIENASRRFRNASFIQADLMDWSPPAQPFDIVVSQEVLEHIEDQRRFMEIAASLLRSGGYLILTTPNLNTVRVLPESDLSTQPIEHWVDRKALQRLADLHFSKVKITSLILAHHAAGFRRFFLSRRSLSAVGRVGLASVWETAALHFGLGLHLLLIARKP
jgi:2-polyprenyl-3-methyl-5-hydroxy-6-metoxy-1,4-benzoquinol methylase